MAPLHADEDAFGQALIDHHEGRNGPLLILEADDGSFREADVQPPDFFSPYEGWPSWERGLIDAAAGAVLDLGAGAGRHAVHLQRRGHRVTAVDISPGAASVCRARGIGDVRCADLRDLSNDDRWDTILLMCGNLGLAGDWEPARRLLERLAHMTSAGGLLIADTVDPSSDDPVHRAYERRNEELGFHRGHVRLRLHYGARATPWWDLINIPPGDIDELIAGTGWSCVDSAGDDDGYGVVLRRT